MCAQDNLKCSSEDPLILHNNAGALYIVIPWCASHSQTNQQLLLQLQTNCQIVNPPGPTLPRWLLAFIQFPRVQSDVLKFIFPNSP